MRKINVYSNHFKPENFKINDIAFDLSKDNQVTVSTQIPNYPKGKYFNGYGLLKKRKENIGNLEIERIAVIPRGTTHLQLLMNYLSYIVSSFFYFFVKRKSLTDVVFLFITSLIFVSWAAIRHANKQQSKKVMYLLDLWPSNLFTMIHIENKWVKKIVTRMCVNIYNEMDEILISSLMFKDVLLGYGIPEEKITYLPQHVRDIKNIEPRGKDENLNILFAGNIGEAQGLEILVDVCKGLKDRGVESIHFSILGEGRYKEKLIKQTTNENVIEYFTFFDGVPQAEVMNYYRNCDFGLVTLGDDESLNKHLPAKVQDYMGHQIPILALAGGETKRVVSEANAGLVFDSKNINDLINSLVDLSKINHEDISILGKNGLMYAKEHFSFESTMKVIRKSLGN